jgi:hypothetical protein
VSCFPVGPAQQDHNKELACNQLFWHVLDDIWNKSRSDFDDFVLCFSWYVSCFPVGPAQSDQDTKYGPLTDLLDMYPTILGLIFDISSIDISRSSLSSESKYPVFHAVWLSKTKAKH